MPFYLDLQGGSRAEPLEVVGVSMWPGVLADLRTEPSGWAAPLGPGGNREAGGGHRGRGSGAAQVPLRGLERGVAAGEEALISGCRTCSRG